MPAGRRSAIRQAGSGQVKSRLEKAFDVGSWKFDVGRSAAARRIPHPVSRMIAGTSVFIRVHPWLKKFGTDSSAVRACARSAIAQRAAARHMLQRT
jgi:hypothetical protein